MNKSKVRDALGDSVVLSNTAEYRVWLESVLIDGEKRKKARYVITLLSYWLNANDDTYCPVDADDIRETTNILLAHIATEANPHLVNKYRYDYDSLGQLETKRYVGGVTIANTIHLLDLICEEYDGRKCKKCCSKMTKSEIYCTRCGERFDFKYNF